MARPAVRGRRRPGHRDRADARLEGGDLLLRAGRAGREAPRRRAGARLPGLRARRALRRRRHRHRAATRASTAGCPTSTRSRSGTRSPSSGRATRTTRPGRPRRSRSTRSSRRGHGSTGFLLCSDEAYSELCFAEPAGLGAPGRRPRATSSCFNTLSKRSSMTGYPLRVRLRRAGDRRRAAGLPAVDRDGAAGVRPGAPGSPPSATRSTSRRCASSTGASARRSCRCSSGTGSARRAARRPSSSGSPSTGPSEPFARRLLEHGILVAPGSFFGAAGEGYVRMALVPTQADCERAADLLEGAL